MYSSTADIFHLPHQKEGTLCLNSGCTTPLPPQQLPCSSKAGILLLLNSAHAKTVIQKSPTHWRVLARAHTHTHTHTRTKSGLHFVLVTGCVLFQPNKLESHKHKYVYSLVKNIFSRYCSIQQAWLVNYSVWTSEEGGTSQQKQGLMALKLGALWRGEEGLFTWSIGVKCFRRLQSEKQVVLGQTGSLGVWCAVVERSGLHGSVVLTVQWSSRFSGLRRLPASHSRLNRSK